MYQVHPDFVTPDDSCKLWRYLDVGKFLGLIDTQALYFAKLAELDDSWEAAHPVSLRKFVESEFVDKDGIPQLAPMFQFMARSAGVNCWHENNGESVAMWSLYNSGDEGVVVQTTVGRLKYALRNEPRAVLIGRVNYINYDQDPISIRLNVISPLMHKRVSFRHEAEVRAIMPFLQEPGAKPVKMSDTLSRIPDAPSVGLAVPVNIVELIERIVVSPRFPRWAIASLENIVSRFGLKVPIGESDLLKDPPAY